MPSKQNKKLQCQSVTEASCDRKLPEVKVRPQGRRADAIRMTTIGRNGSSGGAARVVAQKINASKIISSLSGSTTEPLVRRPASKRKQLSITVCTQRARCCVALRFAYCQCVNGSNSASKILALLALQAETVAMFEYYNYLIDLTIEMYSFCFHTTFVAYIHSQCFHRSKLDSAVLNVISSIDRISHLLR